MAAVRSSVRDAERLWLPGGGMKVGESPRETIEREIREELGRRAHVGKPIAGALQHFLARDEACWYAMEATFLAGELRGKAPSPGKFEPLWIDPATEEIPFFHPSPRWAAELGLGGKPG